MERTTGPRPARRPERPVRVTRSASIPDVVRLARLRHAPELGSRLLFFSGGSALRGLSAKLIEYTHHSRHLITPFDSGGSSAKLRAAFRMPAVGDLRNRLMSLADTSVLGNPQIYDLFVFRFPHEGRPSELVRRLDNMVRGRDSQVRQIPLPMRSIVRRHLGFFREKMPEGFDLRGAAIGNLVLAGGYLNQGRKLDSVIYLFSQLVEVRGIVRPIVDHDLHLAALLRDGRTVIGQHKITGRETAALPSPIERICLSRTRTMLNEVRPRISKAVEDLIRSSDLICFPVGSFYTSVVANLLPDGVSDAISETDVPKVYVPNPGHDPEEVGMTLVDRVSTLSRYLRAGASRPTPTERLLNFVLVDAERSRIAPATLRQLDELGLGVIDVPLISTTSAPYLDDGLLAEALLSLT